MNKMTSKQFLAKIHREDIPSISFNVFIQYLRVKVAKEYGYILSAVSYDDIVLDLVDLGELEQEVLLYIDFKD